MSNNSFTSAIIVCAGNGTRMGSDISKVLIPVGEHQALFYTIKAFEQCNDIDEIVLVIRECDRDIINNLVSTNDFAKVKSMVRGGDTRSKSVSNGLSAINKKSEYVAIHDGARCLISSKEISSVVNSAYINGASVLGVPVTDTIKTVDTNGMITGNVDRNTLSAMQTPQVFLRSNYEKAVHKADNLGDEITDDCILMEKSGYAVTVVNGSYENIKLTTKSDLLFARAILQSRGES